jgi:hypothetical protein
MMMEKLASLQRMCESRLSDVQAGPADRADMVNVGTVLFLTAGKLRERVSAVGNAFRQGTHDATQALDAASAHLGWVRSNVQTADVEEVRARVLQAGENVLGVLRWLLRDTRDGQALSGY